ncbi:GNAT family N-acetyltransferase [Sulfobacillus sp. DSM 109850]|uniref:GNAT family N-acetyltransferase n=1 Tax=Sulfobacillus harzensis TaxID=2729629 RepID=A0A7Y0L7W6_9FIRM|nr:GNAT family N-acetyltransferase [Sulfobacillus harzensis]
MTIQAVDPKRLPRDLLYLADPSETLVELYLTRGHGLAAFQGDKVLGVLVWLDTRPGTREIVNLAVRPEEQNKGIGRALLEAALREAREANVLSIELGTGNSSIGQLALYQKCGFRIVGVDPDFFLRHYSEPIFENGIRCRDMVRLRCDLEG